MGVSSFRGHVISVTPVLLNTVPPVPILEDSVSGSTGFPPRVFIGAGGSGIASCDAVRLFKSTGLLVGIVIEAKQDTH